MEFCGCLKLINECKWRFMKWCCRSCRWRYSSTAIIYNSPKQHGSYAHAWSVQKNTRCIYWIWHCVYENKVFRRLLVCCWFLRSLPNCTVSEPIYIYLFAFWTCFNNGSGDHSGSSGRLLSAQSDCLETELGTRSDQLVFLTNDIFFPFASVSVPYMSTANMMKMKYTTDWDIITIKDTFKLFSVLIVCCSFLLSEIWIK